MKSFISLVLIVSAVSWAGFEIGNGRKIIKSADGSYTIVVPDKTEVGTVKNYTEVIAPLAAGTPRTRLQINVVKDSELRSLSDLIDSRKDSSWKQVKLSGLDGIQKEETLPTRLRQIEIRLFLSPGEIVVVNLEGAPGPSLLTPYEALKDSLESLKIVKP